MTQNILIVEDHELTRFGLKTTFEGVDYIEKIFEAESAETAIEIFKNNSIVCMSCAWTLRQFPKLTISVKNCFVHFYFHTVDGITSE